MYGNFAFVLPWSMLASQETRSPLGVPFCPVQKVTLQS